MKKMYYLLLFMFFVSCSKSEHIEGEYIKARLVRNTCVDPLVQVLDSNYFHLAENWLDTSIPESAIIREHVFAVDNPCDYTTRELTENDEFYFTITPDSNPCCVVCAMLVYSPATRHKIKIRNNP